MAKEFDPTEVDRLHAEIEKDLSEGNGAKHFEDVLDELHSKRLPSDPSDPSDPISAERNNTERYKELRAFCFALKRKVTEELLSQGLRCDYVEMDEDELVVACSDMHRRQHEVKVPYETLFDLQRQNPGDARGYFVQVVGSVCKSLLNARTWYFKRMERGINNVESID